MAAVVATERKIIPAAAEHKCPVAVFLFRLALLDRVNAVEIHLAAVRPVALEDLAGAAAVVAEPDAALEVSAVLEDRPVALAASVAVAAVAAVQVAVKY